MTPTEDAEAGVSEHRMQAEPGEEPMTADTDEGVEGWEKLWPVPDAYLAEKLEEDAEWMPQDHPARRRMEVAARRLRNRESEVREAAQMALSYFNSDGRSVGRKRAVDALRTALTQDREPTDE